MLGSKFLFGLGWNGFAHIKRGNEISVSNEEKCFETKYRRVKFEMTSYSAVGCCLKDSLLLTVKLKEFEGIRADVSLPREFICTHHPSDTANLFNFFLIL